MANNLRQIREADEEAQRLKEALAARNASTGKATTSSYLQAATAQAKAKAKAQASPYHPPPQHPVPLSRCAHPSLSLSLSLSL